MFSRFSIYIPLLVTVVRVTRTLPLTITWEKILLQIHVGLAYMQDTSCCKNVLLLAHCDILINLQCDWNVYCVNEP